MSRACLDCHISINHRHGNAVRCEPCQKVRADAKLTVRDRPCSVDTADCSPGRLKQGMCELHYRRRRKTGTTDLMVVDQYARYEVDANGCWLWTGPMFRNGYGSIADSTGFTLAHRAFYSHHIGPIPQGLDLDHLCRVRHCVNPNHLEPVNRSVNIQRGVDARTDGFCKRGHDQRVPDARWTEPGTGRSYCRICKSIREKQGRKRRRAG